MKLNPIKLNIQRFYFTGQYFEPRDMLRVKKCYDENDNLIYKDELFKFKTLEVNVDKKIINYFDDCEIHLKDEKTKPIEIEKFDYIKEVDFNIDGIEEYYTGEDEQDKKFIITGSSDGTEKVDYPYLVKYNDELYCGRCFFDENGKMIISYCPSLGKIEDDYTTLTVYGKKQKQTIYQLKNKETKAITTVDYNYQVYHHYKVHNPKSDEIEIVHATKKDVESIIRLWDGESHSVTINYCDKNNRVLYWEEIEIGETISKVEDSGEYAGYNVTIYYSADNYKKVIWYEVLDKLKTSDDNKTSTP